MLKLTWHDFMKNDTVILIPVNKLGLNSQPPLESVYKFRHF